MTIAAFARSGAPVTDENDTEYQAGACNIGPAEISRRRQTGHIGVIATCFALAVLIAVDAPPPFRLLLVIPAAVAASGYLQAWLRFCAAFGWSGIANFGPLGRAERVADAEDRARDRNKSFQIGAASLAVGVGVALVALLLPG